MMSGIADRSNNMWSLLILEARAWWAIICAGPLVASVVGNAVNAGIYRYANLGFGIHRWR
jgi:uncharacterized membrane protein YoaK (UPF0700 family)